MQKKILIASDHAGTELKAAVQKALLEFQWTDLGPSNTESVDYPDYAAKVCEAIQNRKAETGILICGSGIGMSIAANKFKGIRAALVGDLKIASLAREHNNANVLCLASRFTAPELAIEIARKFLTTPFSNDTRHHNRVAKLTALDN